jgi:O-antigen/teichoic acid export membrane protein
VNLRDQALSGVRWTSTSTLIRVSVQVVQLLVLARLLPPADFGNMSVVLAVIAFLQMFADLGVGNAIIHARQISAVQLSSLYWTNVAMGVVLALAVALASPALAAFYGEPVLQPLLALAALSLLAGCLWQQLRVVAEKEMRFARVAWLEIAASVAALPVSVAMAIAGAGVYALLGGVLASAAVGAILAWPMLAGTWRPQLQLRLGEIREFLRFGLYMMGNNLANTLNLSLDVLLGARLLGPQPIGLYSVSKNLCLQVTMAINPVITRVSLPLMARLQEDDLLLKNVYLNVMRMTASANSPIFVAIAFFAAEIVHLVLGPQWDAAIPLLQILAGWALLRATGNPVGTLLMARGRADLSFQWNVAWLPIFALAAWLGSRFGASGLAAAIGALGILGLVPNWYFLVKPLCGARFGEYFREIGIPLALSLAAGLAALAAAAPFSGDVTRLSVGVGCGAVAYLALSRYFNPSWPAAILELLGPWTASRRAGPTGK